MPKLNVFQSSTSTAGPTQTRQLSAANIGGAVQSFGKSVIQTAGVLADKVREEQRFKANSQLVNAQAELFEQMEASKVTMSPDGKGFSDGIEKMVTQRREQLLEGAESDFQRDILSSKMDAIGLSMFKHSKNFEIQTASAFEANQVRQGIVKSTNSARANPNFVDDLWAGQQELIENSPNILAKMKPTLLNQARADLYDSALDGTVTSFVNQKNNSTADVDAMIEMVKGGDPRWKDNSSRRGFDGALDRLEAYKARLNTQRKSENLDAFKEEMTYLSTTGDDRRRYTEQSVRGLGFDDRTTNRMLEQLDAAQRVGKVKPYVNTTSLPEIVEGLDADNLNARLKEDPTKTNEILAEHAAKITALKDRERRAADNAPTYMMSVDPDLAQEFTNFEQLASSGASMEEVQQAATDYVSAVKAKSEQLWPGRVPSILPKQKIGQIAKVIQESGTNPQQLVQVMQREQQIWGENWPLVVRDLKQAKAISSEQYVAATMFDRPEVTYLADEMIAASTVKESQLKEDIGEAEYKDLRLEAKDEMDDFLQSIRHMSPESYNSIKESFVDSVTKLGAYQMSKGQTPDMADLANKVINDKYSFEDGYRIPVEQEPSEIVEKVEDLYGQLGTFEYVAPMHDAYGLDEDATQSRLRSHMAANAKIVNDNDFGLRVIDGHGRQVSIMENGKPKALKFTWDEIRAGFETRLEKDEQFQLIGKGIIKKSVKRAKGEQ